MSNALTMKNLRNSSKRWRIEYMSFPSSSSFTANWLICVIVVKTLFGFLFLFSHLHQHKDSPERGGGMFDEQSTSSQRRHPIGPIIPPDRGTETHKYSLSLPPSLPPSHTMAYSCPKRDTHLLDRRSPSRKTNESIFFKKRITPNRIKPFASCASINQRASWRTCAQSTPIVVSVSDWNFLRINWVILLFLFSAIRQSANFVSCDNRGVHGIGCLLPNIRLFKIRPSHLQLEWSTFSHRL